MKLLLTSAGIQNAALAEALAGLVDKPKSETQICLVPTAANVERGEKDWFIKQFTNLYRHGFSWVDMVDPSATQVDWQSRMAAADVIFVSGGNTFHLLEQARRTGFDTWLRDNLDSNKAYVGVSAGSIIATPRIDVATIEPADENLSGLQDLTGLNMVSFEVEPHCEGERFNTIERYAKQHGREIYAIDDDSAVQVIDGVVSIVSTGKWKHFDAKQ